MNLKRHLEAVSESFGLIHQVKLRALRLYLKETDEAMLIREIDAIDEPKVLRVLWEAGLNSRLQEAVLKKLV